MSKHRFVQGSDLQSMSQSVMRASTVLQFDWLITIVVLGM